MDEVRNGLNFWLFRVFCYKDVTGFRNFSGGTLAPWFYLPACVLYWMLIWLWVLKVCYLQSLLCFWCFGSTSIHCLGFMFWIVIISLLCVILDGWWFMSVDRSFIAACHCLISPFRGWSCCDIYGFCLVIWQLQVQSW